MSVTRWTVAKRLVDLLTAHPDLASTQVEPGWPGDTRRSECIWIESLNGTEEVAYMSGGPRVVTDDRFEIPLQIWVANRADLFATYDRLDEIIDAVRDIVKEDPVLGFDPETDGVLETDLGQADSTAGRTPEGLVGVARMVLTVHERLF